ncbi:hypothetical protein ACIO93_24025 [Streptomyces sp. NPDC087903]|uniref:hypothetical protein n=1 Tax=Streptomyces sp. NPDC087903 TaxID=3365819 RepID=UPI0038215BF8
MSEHTSGQLPIAATADVRQAAGRLPTAGQRAFRTALPPNAEATTPTEEPAR